MNPTTVRVADEVDRDHAVAVLVAAFLSDPVARWCWPEPAAYLRNAASFMNAYGGGAFHHGSAFVERAFSGCALWLPPGETPDEEALGTLIGATMEKEKQGHIFSSLEELSTYHPKGSYWYLPLIGVDPVRQGEGVGSALLSTALAVCDEAGLPAYLESTTPRNVSLYERHGFKVVGKVQCGDCPAFTPMVRDAQ